MKHFATPVAWYGRPEAPPKCRTLRAGNLQAEYVQGDLRYIRLARHECLRRIYAAVRDVNWNTLPAVMSQERLRIEQDHFEISFAASHRSAEIDFTWQAHIAGNPDGTIRYHMEGQANRDFRYCRIGFCVLHPIAGIVGNRYAATTPGGILSGTFPTQIVPQTIEDGYEVPMFPACSALRVEMEDGISIDTVFEGDLFEMEDQRNWTDGSFKTYCTPLALGYPHQAHAGQKFVQTITVRIGGSARSEETTPQHAVEIFVDKPTERKLPQIGFGLPPDQDQLTSTEVERLARLHPAHVRVEVHLGDPVWRSSLERAMHSCQQIGAALEIVVFLTDNGLPEARILAQQLVGASVARMIVFHEREAGSGTTSQQWIDLARTQIRPLLPDVPLFGGTNGNFAELNRQRPSPVAMDGVSYTVNPQVHASDELSLIEALEAQPETVTTARSFWGSKPIAISAITLKPPFNQAAVEAEASDPNVLPANVDPRQMSLFAACWTVGSLAMLTRTDVNALTYYQLTGWRGLIERATGCPLPEQFLSQPGMVFPVYWVFEWLARFPNAFWIDVDHTHPLRTAALAVRTDAHLALMVANLEAIPNTITIHGLPGGQRKRRRLSAESYEVSAMKPEVFVDSASLVNAPFNEPIELLAYEISFIEVTSEEGKWS